MTSLKFKIEIIDDSSGSALWEEIRDRMKITISTSFFKDSENERNKFMVYATKMWDLACENYVKHIDGMSGKK